MNFCKLVDKYTVTIPMIQRDYAQGRTDDKSTEVRTRFLDGILSEKIKKIDLIFGTKDSKVVFKFSCSVSESFEMVFSSFLIQLHFQHYLKILMCFHQFFPQCFHSNQ